jgi:hypothetical protein
MLNPTSTAPARPARARLIGVVVFGVLVGACTVVFTYQIFQQAFGWGATPSAEPCAVGLERLSSTILQARQSATKGSDADSALAQYREALASSWADANRVRKNCQKDPALLERFLQVERLRFAEEQAILYESRQLAVARRAVETLRQEFVSPPIPSLSGGAAP